MVPFSGGRSLMIENLLAGRVCGESYYEEVDDSPSLGWDDVNNIESRHQARKAGEITGFSMAGSAEVDHDENIEKFDADQARDEFGRWTSGGGTISPGAPIQAWRDPPPPRGKAGRKAGGYTATGHTNTSVGDTGESLLIDAAGMQSLLPSGKRQNPLDARFDSSKDAYEIKTVTSASTEYKVKMKSSEIALKIEYAKANGLKAGVILLVLDQPSGTAYAYKRDGIANGKLNSKDWQFLGKMRFTGMKKFDPDQPRDENGRWGEGGRGKEVSMKASEEYALGLKQELRSRANAAGLRAKMVETALGYRTEIGDTSFAMAEHVEERSSRAAALSSIESQMAWGTNFAGAAKEWQAAEKLGGSGSKGLAARSAVKESPPLSDDEVSAFRARQEFTQVYVRDQFAGKIDAEGNIELYRGVSGSQGRKIREAGGQEVDLAVHSLSSFTLSRRDAEDFARGKNGVVLKVKVPVKDLWSAPRMTSPHQVIRFSEDSGELVVLNSAKYRRAVVD